jgi:hypothetical protein
MNSRNHFRLCNELLPNCKPHQAYALGLLSSECLLINHFPPRAIVLSIVEENSFAAAMNSARKAVEQTRKLAKR